MLKPTRDVDLNPDRDDQPDVLLRIAVPAGTTSGAGTTAGRAATEAQPTAPYPPPPDSSSALAPAENGAGSAAVPGWLRRYVICLVLLDTLSFAVGGLLGYLARFDLLPGHPVGFSYRHILLLAAPFWVLAMVNARAYEPRFLGIGSEEFRRVGNAAARFTALLAFVVFMFKWDVARGLVALALPAATACTLLLRLLARRVLHRLRQDGAASHRVLILGEGPALDALRAHFGAAPHSGLRVVGTCHPGAGNGDERRTVARVKESVTALNADTVAIAHCGQITSRFLRRLAWSLEGSGVILLVAPALSDVAGPRVNIRPVSGVPLLQVAEPRFTGMRRLAKTGFDIAVAGTCLVLASPLLGAIAIAVRISGTGPVLFRQTRIGKDGREFTMYKFRSMYADAEDRLAELLDRNDHGDGVLFKMHDDPRITYVGHFLRRFSLDELPQLLNVLRGQMSLVGPRPPLPTEVARYDRDVHRRLLVKPGITGLWQVSGRSDLTWDETVRLDLYYVENWSVALDAEILSRTLSAVLKGGGAR